MVMEVRKSCAIRDGKRKVMESSLAHEERRLRAMACCQIKIRIQCLVML